MQNVTILGEIHDGRIHTEQSLSPFEGKKVVVSVQSAEVPVVRANGSLPAEPTYGEDEPVILEDLGRIPISPRNVTTLSARIIDVGRIPPRVYPSDEEE